MAVYMSPNRQRRRVVLVAVAALVVGAILGVVLGRATATTVADEVDASRTRGRRVAAALRALPIEYEQLRTGTGENSQLAFDDAVHRIVDQATTALDAAPWLRPSSRDRVSNQVEAVEKAVEAKVTPDEFRTTIDEAATTVEDVFDSPNTSGGDT